ncbi:MAG: hypothetical protein RLZZ399_2929, partial [Verrucomicrobiota bacterium]
MEEECGTWSVVEVDRTTSGFAVAEGAKGHVAVEGVEVGPGILVEDGVDIDVEERAAEVFAKLGEEADFKTDIGEPVALVGNGGELNGDSQALDGGEEAVGFLDVVVAFREIADDVTLAVVEGVRCRVGELIEPGGIGLVTPRLEEVEESGLELELADDASGVLGELPRGDAVGLRGEGEVLVEGLEGKTGEVMEAVFFALRVGEQVLEAEAEEIEPEVDACGLAQVLGGGEVVEESGVREGDPVGREMEGVVESEEGLSREGGMTGEEKGAGVADEEEEFLLGVPAVFLDLLGGVEEGERSEWEKGGERGEEGCPAPGDGGEG